LTRIGVVDLTRTLAGPFCPMIFADMGAEVIKIEHRRPDAPARGIGDPMRRQGAINGPPIASQEMLISADHPGHGEVRMRGFPLKFTEGPCRLRRPAPDLGADTDDALHELGYPPRRSPNCTKPGPCENSPHHFLIQGGRISSR
jgi:crotonobetainyl-CoA:carnitine CoA-transferase CaiB-like acyl-CoA transferase